MRKHSQDLAKEYEVNNIFEYIVESLINGNKKQVRSIFNELKPYDQEVFLNEWCNYNAADMFGKGFIKSIRNMCISELINNQK